MPDPDLAQEKAAGEVLTAKQAPHRPGTAPALGLRAGNDVSPLYRRPTWKRRLYHVIHQLAAQPALHARSGPDGTRSPAAAARSRPCDPAAGPRATRGPHPDVVHGFAGRERSRPPARWQADHLDRHGYRMRERPRVP